MTQTLPSVTEPTKITLPGGVILQTTIDPQTQRHLVECDICGTTVKLTTTAHPHGISEHRRHCIRREEGKQALADRRAHV